MVNAYVLVFGGFLLLGGRMADFLGRRLIFMAGLVLFALASLVGGFSESQGMISAARAVQGLGGALMSPAALSILQMTFTEGAERNRALGVWGAVAGSGGAVGVLLGGVLTDGLGWQWVLWVNVPVGLGAALLVPRLIAESRVTSATRTFDAAGAVSITAGLAILVYALVDANDAGWGSAQTLGLLALAAALIAAFVVVELRSAHPLVPFRFFRNRTVTGGRTSRAAARRRAVRHVLLPVALHAAGARLRRARRRGRLPAARPVDHRVVRGGVAARHPPGVQARPARRPPARRRRTRLAEPHLGRRRLRVGHPRAVDPHGPGARLLVRAADRGRVSGVRPDDAGLASGLINTAQQVGGALGLAVLATVANGRRDSALKAAGGDPGALPAALVDGFSAAFLAGAGLIVLGFVAALVLIRAEDSEAQIGAEVAPVPAA